MVEYHNPTPPEGINVTATHPLRELLILGTGFLGIMIFVLLVSFFAGSKIAPYIPFSWEQKFLPRPALPVGTAEGSEEIERYLQSLSDRLTRHMDLPEGMSVVVHYVDQDIVNAVAAPGGHVFVFCGLANIMPNENALAMVLGHEAAHVKNRDVISALGGRALVSLALAVAGLGDSAIGGVAGGTDRLLSLKFSRDRERAADLAAISALNKSYGHVSGSNKLFEHLHKLRGNKEQPPGILQSHPLDELRIAALDAYTKAQGFAASGTEIPLPSFLHRKCG
jgi:Zn-dependent protease with chaperone function